jgi:hemolysin III
VSSVHDDLLKIISSIFYGSSLVIMYASSTLYHSFSYPKLKRYFRILDHTSIYLLIAGTYTPFTLVTLDGAWGWTLFGIIWGLAIFGITFKLIFKHRFEIMSLIIYLIMGWICLIAVKPLWEALPLGGLTWMLLGGLAYTGGITFYVWEKLPFSHTIWHLFVLMGSTCHFIAVLFYVIL